MVCAGRSQGLIERGNRAGTTQAPGVHGHDLARTAALGLEFLVEKLETLRPLDFRAFVVMLVLGSQRHQCVLPRTHIGWVNRIRGTRDDHRSQLGFDNHVLTFGSYLSGNLVLPCGLVPLVEDRVVAVIVIRNPGSVGLEAQVIGENLTGSPGFLIDQRQDRVVSVGQVDVAGGPDGQGDAPDSPVPLARVEDPLAALVQIADLLLEQSLVIARRWRGDVVSNLCQKLGYGHGVWWRNGRVLARVGSGPEAGGFLTEVVPEHHGIVILHDKEQGSLGWAFLGCPGFRGEFNEEGVCGLAHRG